MSVPAGIFSSIGDNRYEYCFAAGTLVLMADGSRKAIEKIETGEMVLAAPDTDPEAEPRPCRVLEVYHNPPARLLPVTIAGPGDVGGGETIFTTAEHPFYVRGRGWTKAAELRPGEKLRSPGGGWARVKSACDAGRTAPVFNLRVQSAHTYFVCAAEAGAAVLVHNDSVVQSGPCYDCHPLTGQKKVLPPLVPTPSSSAPASILPVDRSLVLGPPAPHWQPPAEWLAPVNVFPPVSQDQQGDGSTLEPGPEEPGAAMQIFNNARQSIFNAWLDGVDPAGGLRDGLSKVGINLGQVYCAPGVDSDQFGRSTQRNGQATNFTVGILGGAGLMNAAGPAVPAVEVAAPGAPAAGNATADSFAGQAERMIAESKAARGLPSGMLSQGSKGVTLLPEEGYMGFVKDGEVYVDLPEMRGATHCGIANQSGLVDAKGNLLPGVEGFRVFKGANGNIWVGGSHAYADLSPAAEAVVRAHYK